MQDDNTYFAHETLREPNNPVNEAFIEMMMTLGEAPLLVMESLHAKLSDDDDIRKHRIHRTAQEFGRQTNHLEHAGYVQTAADIDTKEIVKGMASADVIEQLRTAELLPEDNRGYIDSITGDAKNKTGTKGLKVDSIRSQISHIHEAVSNIGAESLNNTAIADAADDQFGLAA
jgi:hypothetical protein